MKMNNTDRMTMRNTLISYYNRSLLLGNNTVTVKIDGRKWEYWYDNTRDMLVTVGTIRLGKNDTSIKVPEAFDVFGSKIWGIDRLEEINLSYVQYCTERIDLFRCMFLKRFIAQHLVTTKLVTEDLKDVVTNWDFVVTYAGRFNLQGIEATDLAIYLTTSPCWCSLAQECYIKLSKKNLRYTGFKTMNYVIHQLSNTGCAISSKNMQWFQKKRFRMKSTDIGYATLKVHNGE